ncbi:MAG: hypothetical protein WBP86_04885 [Thiobacillaceae bacterium]
MITLQILLSTLILTLLAACGGGGGGGGSGTATQGSISGTAIKGPMSNATVKAFAISLTNGQMVMGSLLGTSQATGSNGNFTMHIGSYAGPMMLQVNGNSASWTDEAGRGTMTMPSGEVMTAVIPDVTAGETISGIQVTPLTAMAQRMAQHISGGMTAANITAANTAMGNYFSVSDILQTTPMNPLANNSGIGATTDMRNYGMVLAAMSQEAKTLNTNMNTADLVTAMMNDCSDGAMNGMMSGGAISMSMGGGMMGTMASNAGTSGLGAAMTSFINTPNLNASGLTTTDMAAIINKLNASNGQIPCQIGQTACQFM